MAKTRNSHDPPDPTAQGRLAYALTGLPPRRAAGERAVTAAGRSSTGSIAAEAPAVEGAALETLEELPEVRRFSRTHLGVVVALVALGLVWAGWGLLRARPVAVASPTAVTTVASASASTITPDPSPSASPAPTLVVHVLGAVRRPGLVQLPERSRVQDAIRSAGGLARNADPGELNLAQLLTDGEQIVIGTRRAPAGEVRDGGGTEGGGTAAGSTAPTVDLNRATETQLESLPGVGPVTAGKIVAWRTEHHRFSRVEELQEVDGIGPKTYAQIAPHVRV